MKKGFLVLLIFIFYFLFIFDVAGDRTSTRSSTKSDQKKPPAGAFKKPTTKNPPQLNASKFTKYKVKKFGNYVMESLDIIFIEF